MSATQLQAHMNEHGISQAKVATMLGVSTGAISQYLKGKYAGDVESIDKKVKEMLARSADRAKDIKTDFVLTETASAIMNVCAMAHTMNDINLVIGEAGLGKTMAIKAYASDVENVILIETEPTFSPKVLLIELCQKLGLTPAKSNHDNISAVIEKLSGSERLIIIDEAELLSYKCLEVIRRIHDKSGVGVVLAGMPQLRKNLRGNRGEYKQLYSRVGFACDLQDKLPDACMGALIESALGTSDFNEALIKVSHGNARRLNKVLRGVNRLSKLNKMPINAKLIEKTCHMLID